MTALTHDLYIEQGANFSQTIIVKDGSGDPLDLSGSLAKCEIRRSHSDSKTLASVTCEITDPEMGEIKLRLSPSETAAIPVEGVKAGTKLTHHVYDLSITFPDNRVIRILQGKASISPRITK